MDILTIKKDSRALKIPCERELYRYLSGERFETLLCKKELYFCNVKKELDKRERMIPSSFWPKNKSETQIKVADKKQECIKAYITCWTKSKDNCAFWKIYGQNKQSDCNNKTEYAACMIATTYQKLEDCFDKKAVFYEVEYINPESCCKDADIPEVYFDVYPPVSVLATEKYKIIPYEFEKEVRGVVYSLDDEPGVALSICPKELIDSIIISPFANDDISQVHICV